MLGNEEGKRKNCMLYPKMLSADKINRVPNDRKDSLMADVLPH